MRRIAIIGLAFLLLTLAMIFLPIQSTSLGVDDDSLKCRNTCVYNCIIKKKIFYMPANGTPIQCRKCIEKDYVKNRVVAEGSLTNVGTFHGSGCIEDDHSDSKL